jgi:hypothetical protein
VFGAKRMDDTAIGETIVEWLNEHAKKMARASLRIERQQD